MSGTSPAPVVVSWSPDEHGAAAWQHGLARARSRGSSLVVVNASRGDALVDPRFATETALDALRAEAREAHVPLEVRRGVGGEVADQVLEVADEVDAALVVVGLRRRTPVGKLIMGSVAQRLLLTARCPVLAVKPGQAPVS